MTLVLFLRTLCWTQDRDKFLLFLSRNGIGLAFTFRPVIPCELVFGSGRPGGSQCTLFAVTGGRKGMAVVGTWACPAG